jgi:hypothetical protein
MTYRLFLRSKRNRIEHTEKVLVGFTVEEALEAAARHYFNWDVQGIEQIA